MAESLAIFYNIQREEVVGMSPDPSSNHRQIQETSGRKLVFSMQLKEKTHERAEKRPQTVPADC